MSTFSRGRRTFTWDDPLTEFSVVTITVGKAPPRQTTLGQLISQTNGAIIADFVAAGSKLPGAR